MALTPSPAPRRCGCCKQRLDSDGMLESNTSRFDGRTRAARRADGGLRHGAVPGSRSPGARRGAAQRPGGRRRSSRAATRPRRRRQRRIPWDESAGVRSRSMPPTTQLVLLDAKPRAGQPVAGRAEAAGGSARVSARCRAKRCSAGSASGCATGGRPSLRARPPCWPSPSRATSGSFESRSKS